MPSPTSLSSVRQDAIARRDRGDLNSARTLLERALEAATMTSGEDHPEVLTTAHLLASLHRQAGDLSAARRVLENALYAGTNRHGEEHPLMLSISFELAEIADELGNRHEARRHYTRVAKYGPGAVSFNQQQVQAARAWLGPSAPAAVAVQGRPVTLPAPETIRLPSETTTVPTPPAADDDFGLGPATSPPRFGPAPTTTTTTITPPPQEPATMRLPPLAPEGGAQTPAPQRVPAWPQPPARPPQSPPPQSPSTQGPPQTIPVGPPPQSRQPQGAPPQAPPPQSPPPQSPPRHGLPPQGAPPSAPKGVTQQGVPTPRPPMLNPPSAYPSSPVVAGPHPAPAHARKRGKGVLIGSLFAAFIAVVAAGTAVYLVLNNAKGSPGPDSNNLPATNVAISVKDDRVTLTWSDPSNGGAQPIIVGFRESEGQRRFAVPAKGATEAVITGLNKNYEYCFSVVLVYTEDDLKPSEQVCTDRKKASPSPSR